MCYFIGNSIIPNEIFHYIIIWLTSQDILNFAKSFDRQLFPSILNKIYHKIKFRENLRKHVGAKPFFPKRLIDMTEPDEDLFYKLNLPINVYIGNQLIGKLMRSTNLINRNSHWIISVSIPNKCIKLFNNVQRGVSFNSNIGYIFLFDAVTDGIKHTFIYKTLNTDALEKYDNYTQALTLVWQLREIIRNNNLIIEQ
ncbi:hypothetical protein QKC54_gp1007 [Megavirus baoshan]|uniref:Uncharacterized protein n=1 Tax=Megavirus baoshan TaxID=2496520 RepID=A0A3Q8U8E4_9VIRU|nr:hypothetical protein QKC54_gp1007 [Megavirus baoshan]AZL89668.1 hypothetical protein Mb0065 [Megavirus baoshan]